MNVTQSQNTFKQKAGIRLSYCKTNNAQNLKQQSKFINKNKRHNNVVFAQQTATLVDKCSEKELNWAIDRFGLKGKKAFVTGGSKGIGRVITDEFVKLGAEVVICSRTQSTVDQAVADYKKDGFKVTGHTCDVQNSKSVQDLMKKIGDDFGGTLDILVNNVGGNADYHETQDFSEEEYDWMMNMNVRSMFLTTKYAFPLLKNSDYGSVTHISSICGGPQAMENNTMYDMSKAAMNQFSRQVACDWGKYKIRSNVIAPWYIATELGLRDLQKGNYQERVLKATPMRTIGTCEDISGLAAFLSSKAAAWITGQTIYVDGGMMVKGFGYDNY